MTRQRLWGLVGQIPLLILWGGLLIFAAAMGLQYILSNQVVLSIGSIDLPLGPLALTGLCMAGLTLIIWFTGAGILLALQTRRHGADYGHAYNLIQTQEFGEAIPLLEQSVATGKQSIEVLTLLARSYAYNAQPSHAHQLIEQAIDLYPASAEPYAALGRIFLLEGNIDQAVEALQIAVERDSRPQFWAELGFALIYAGRNSEALNALERASQAPLPTPEGLRVYHRLMRLYDHAQNPAKAAAAAAKMFSARDGFVVWEHEAERLQGTIYGLRLAREVEEIGRALRQTDWEG